MKQTPPLLFQDRVYEIRYMDIHGQAQIFVDVYEGLALRKSYTPLGEAYEAVLCFGCGPSHRTIPISQVFLITEDRD